MIPSLISAVGLLHKKYKNVHISEWLLHPAWQQVLQFCPPSAVAQQTAGAALTTYWSLCLAAVWSAICSSFNEMSLFRLATLNKERHHAWRFYQLVSTSRVIIPHCICAVTRLSSFLFFLFFFFKGGNTVPSTHELWHLQAVCLLFAWKSFWPCKRFFDWWCHVLIFNIY